MPAGSQPSPTALPHLSVANDIGELPRVAGWLEQAAAYFAWPDRTVFKLDLVLNEALPNIINYAYRDHGLHHIHLRLEDHPEHVTLEIRDDGIAFDPFAETRGPDNSSLETASLGGRGIPLIVAFSTGRDYARVGQTNRLRVLVSKQDAGERQQR